MTIRFDLKASAAGLAVAVGLAACGGDDGSRLPVEEYISRVSADDGAEGMIDPTPIIEDGGASPSVDGPSMGITGGSGTYEVSAAEGTAAILVGVDGVRGLWRVEAGTASTILLSFGAKPPALDFDLTFRAIGAGGGVGEVATFPVELLAVGTGELQVSLSWNTETDVDLHVVEPGGEEIFYANEVSAAGGMLDLDSNAACVLDNVNNENVTWTSAPPRGEYIVRVDYWSACDEARRTDYVVTVRRRGGVPETFRGSFGPDDETGGGLGDGVEVTRFDY